MENVPTGGHLEEEPSTGSSRTPWTLKHLLLIPLPAVVFVLSHYLMWPKSFRRGYADEGPPSSYVLYKPAIEPLTAFGVSAGLGLLTFILVFCASIRNQKPPLEVNWTSVLVLFTLFFVNLTLVFGGCAAGELFFYSHEGKKHPDPPLSQAEPGR